MPWIVLHHVSAQAWLAITRVRASSWPSSDSSNDWTEVMDEFSDLARVTFKKRKKSRPLFIRHQQTEKRHRLKNTDRADPTSQLLSVHLNAEYREWIEGNAIVVLDVT